jgi:chromosome segregation ATPase
MNFEQIENTDRVNQVKELERERTFLTQKLRRTTQQLKRTEQNIKTLKNGLAQCEEKITFLTDKDTGWVERKLYQKTDGAFPHSCAILEE